MKRFIVKALTNSGVKVDQNSKSITTQIYRIVWL